MAKKKDSRLEKAGVSGYNKPKRTPKHPTKSHVVVAKEGDKIKFLHLKLPNIYQSSAMSFITKLPKELDFHRIIDYNVQFEKSFVEPLKFITDKILWRIDNSYGTQGTLEDFF